MSRTRAKRAYKYRFYPTQRQAAEMLRSGSLARAISDASWAKLRAMLEYKAEWYGRELVTVDRWFPSSKTCSGCGQMVDSLPLHVRVWTCPGCGAAHAGTSTRRETLGSPGWRLLPVEAV